jgi:hypothetical protein
MKLPPDSEIPIRKVTHYLLVPRVETAPFHPQDP